MALKGHQDRLDVNKNGKLDRQDFAQLRNQKPPTSKVGSGTKAKGKKQSMPRKKGM